MKIAYVTNIPTPYRAYRFQLLDKEMKERGHTLDVLYMDKTEPGRNWDWKACVGEHNAFFFKNLGLVTRSGFFHFNPGLLFRLKKNSYDLVVIGGISSPTHMLSRYFCGKSRTVISIESNLDSIKRTGRAVGFLKKVLLKGHDAYQVTGDKAVDYVLHYLKDAEKPDLKFVVLRNIINEPQFDCRKSENDSGSCGHEMKDGKIKIFCAARFEDQKGIKEWVDAIKDQDLSGLHFYFAGSGPELSEVREEAQKHSLPMTFLGNVPSDKIPNYYQESDFFLLPSKRDPSPLSCIEALYVGLPLILSNRVGNSNDVLQNGLNGFTFDIYQPQEIVEVIRKIKSCDSEMVMKMGLESKRIYGERFSPDNMIKNYADELLSLLDT